MKVAIVNVLRDGRGRGFTLAEMTDELARRRWVGTTKDGKPSKETVRGALLNLRHHGVVVGKAEGDTSWEPTVWSLSNTPLTKAPDLYSEADG